MTTVNGVTTGTKNNTETIIATIATAVAFGLITKYGFKKSQGWIVAASAIGAAIGFFADSEWQGHVSINTALSPTPMPAANPVIIQPIV